MNNQKPQKIHIGPLPPPLGGISVYLYRLSKIEKEAIFIDDREINTKTKLIKWIFKTIFDFKKKHFIYHSPSLKLRLAFYFLSLFSRHKYSIVSHGKGLENSYQKANFIIKYLIIKMLKKAEYIQVVNQTLTPFLYKLGIIKDKLLIKNAFLPPSLDEESKILKTLDNRTIEFCKNHKPLIIANAYKLVFKDIIDLYGLDMCIELTAKLKKDFPNVGFLFALANENVRADYLDKIKIRITELNIQNNFHFLVGQKEIWPLFKKADLMVRPTITDGDAVSIREALYFGCSVIASDVCERPEGTILFENRNIDNLHKKCLETLRKQNKNKTHMHIIGIKKNESTNWWKT